MIGVTDVALATMGYTADAVVGGTCKVFTHPDDLAREGADFARLSSGELDYLEGVGRRLRADGTEVDYATHHDRGTQSRCESQLHRRGRSPASPYDRGRSGRWHELGR